MSHSGKPISEFGFNTLSDHLKSLCCDSDDTNKPDFRELDLGSPVSPLLTGPGACSSSSSSGSVSSRNGNGPRRSDSGGTTTADNNSGELSTDSSPTSSAGGSRAFKFGGGSGGYPSSATSLAVDVLPTGNICRSGKILKTGMITKSSPKTHVLSLGTCNYGHGSILRGSSTTGTRVSIISNPSNSRRLLTDSEELKRLGNEQYKKGQFMEALSYYDRAIAISPGNAAYHCNRAAALMSLKRLTEAVKECDEAIKLDSGYIRAHHRLGSLLISLGQVENARKHLCFPGCQPDPNELKKLQAVAKHLNRCTYYRRVRDWAGVLRESDAAIVSGADACPELFACKAEVLLKLGRLDDADLSLLNVPKLEASCSTSYSRPKFFGMDPEAYLLFVRAQINMAFGRFENAVTIIEKSGKIDPRNVEVAVLLQNIRSVSRAWARGNDLFKTDRFMEACSAYGEGLRLDPSNPVLYFNRAACWFKLGNLERALDDCNNALRIHPNYTKALLRRAATYGKLCRWVESVRDYEVLRRALPNNNDIAESLFHAQVALKKSCGEEVNYVKFGDKVESITSLKQFKSTVASTGASVVLFQSSLDLQCKKVSPFLDTLCTRYPSIIFLKVDVEGNPIIANAENVSIVPTIKIYKKGNRVKEMVCPSQEVLESLVKHYNS